MRVGLVCLGIMACSNTQDSKSGEVDPRIGNGMQIDASDPCSPAALKLPNAKRLAAWKAPADCAITAPETPEIVAEATRVVDCKGTSHGFDFANRRLLIGQRTLSPATSGIDALDDGKTITFVSRQVSPCPDDPRPMPVPATLMFVVDQPGERVFAEATCTVEKKCR